jgi:hypothetical protein
MILGALAMIVANAATILGAGHLLKFIKTGRPSLDAVLFMLLRLLLISAAVLAAGAARVLTPTGLGLAGAAIGALLVAFGAHRHLPRSALPSWDRWLIAVAGLVALRLLLQVWFYAPAMGDALAYHLPKIAEWVRAGALTRELGADPRSTFPSGFELIETWWVVFLHHDVLIEMAGVEFLALAAAGAYALARGMEWSSRCAFIAALLFVLTPGLHLQATSCLNDGPVAALLTATTALIVARVHPLLFLIPVGLGIGIKPTFAYALPGLFVLAWLSRRETPVTPPSLRAASILCLGGLLVGSFWYFRNWAFYGNPIHPMGLGGMKSETSGSTLQRLGPSLRSLRENLGCFLDIRVFDRVSAADPTCYGNANWGAAAFALGAPALVLLLRNEPLLRRIMIGLTCSVVCLFSLVELDVWSSRFILFFPLLPALALARLWERHRFVAALGVLALAVLLLATFVPATVPRESLSRMVRENWRTRMLEHPPVLPSGDGPVGFCCDEFGVAYSLYGPSFSRRVVYLREGSLDSLMERLCREKVKVFYTAGALKKKSDMLAEGVRNGFFRRFQEGSWTWYVLSSDR